MEGVEVEIRDATSVTIAELASVITRCFEDYVVPFSIGTPLLASMLRVGTIDLMGTRLAYLGQDIVGVMLLCRRGTLSRIGAFAVAKAHRSRGIGHQLLTRTIEDAIERKDRHMVLEAIETNEGAIRFYSAAGFKFTHRLLGFSKPLSASGATESVDEIDLSELARMLYDRPPETSSWAMSPAAMANSASPNRAFATEGLGVVVSPTSEDVLVCRSMALSGLNDVNKLEKLVGHLGNLWAGRRLVLPPFFPEGEFHDPLLAAGLELDKISQVQMELELAPSKCPLLT